MSGNLKGFLAMLSGRGGREYGDQHRKFRDAIPDHFPTDMTIEERAAWHPAYSGPMANSMDAENYRRAHYMHGPQSKAEHAALVMRQAMMEEYERQVAEFTQRLREIVSS